jgi:hypothetical protein
MDKQEIKFIARIFGITQRSIVGLPEDAQAYLFIRAKTIEACDRGLVLERPLRQQYEKIRETLNEMCAGSENTSLGRS